MPCLSLPRPIEILLVDDQRAILAGVSALIESESPSMRVVGRASTGQEAFDLARSTQPDVIVLDIHLGQENGLELIQQLRGCCTASVVILSGLLTSDTRLDALRLGACACIAKSAPGEVLLAAIRTANLLFSPASGI